MADATGVAPPDIERALTDLEMRRCAAGVVSDVATLSALFAPQMKYVHSTGRIDGREAYLQGVAATSRRAEPGPMEIQVLGEVAVLTGEIVIHAQGDAGARVVRAYLTRVLHRTDDAWRYVLIQATALP